MPAECTYILPSGRTCRCAATHNQLFCRHHGATPVLRRRRPRNQYSRLAQWRDLGRAIPTLPPEEIVFEINGILQALLDNGIADRTAGRLLEALLQRLGRNPFPLPDPNTSAPERYDGLSADGERPYKTFRGD